MYVLLNCIVQSVELVLCVVECVPRGGPFRNKNHASVENLIVTQPMFRPSLVDILLLYYLYIILCMRSVYLYFSSFCTVPRRRTGQNRAGVEMRRTECGVFEAWDSRWPACQADTKGGMVLVATPRYWKRRRRGDNQTLCMLV